MRLLFLIVALVGAPAAANEASDEDEPAAAAGVPGVADELLGETAIEEVPAAQPEGGLAPDAGFGPGAGYPPEVEDAAWPEGGASIEDLDLEQMLGTVSAVSRRSESILKAPATVSTISARRIRLSGMRSVPDLLRTVPGVQVVRSAAGSYLVSLRGLGGLQGNNVVVVVDGIPLNSRVDGSVDWASLPLDVSDIESIEVVRGPISSIWGANAYTGVISIVTRPASLQDRPGGGASMGVGTDLNGEPVMSGAGHIGGGTGPVAWRVSVNALNDQTMNRVPKSPHKLEHPDQVTAGALYKASVELLQGARLELVGGSSFSSRSGLERLAIVNMAQESLTSFGRLELVLDDLPWGIDSATVWTRAKTLAIDVEHLAHVVHYHGFSYDDVTSHDGETGFDVRLDLPWELFISFGASAGLTYVDAPFIHPAENAKLRPSYGVYANADMELFDALLLTGGVRTDRSAMLQGFELSYRASALYHTDLFGLRLAAGSAYREPSYLEVGARVIDPLSGLIQLEGTPGLAPPRVDSAEASVIVVPVPSLRLQPTLYLERVQQLIVEDFGRLTRKGFRNTEHEEIIAGGEVEAAWTFLDHYSAFMSMSLLWWPLEETDPEVATLGEASLNSKVTGYLGLNGTFFEDRLGAGAGAGLATPRSYDAVTGIPPAGINLEVPTTFYLDVAVDAQPLAEVPVWLYGKLITHLPPDSVESPLPHAAQLGTRWMVGIEYRAP